LRIAEFGGEYLAKGVADSKHGSSDFKMTVVIQFANRDTATRWYQSDEYQQLINLRNEAIESQFQIVG